MVLDAQDDIRVVDEAPDGVAAVEAAARLRPDARPSATRRLLDAYGHRLPARAGPEATGAAHPALEALTPREREVFVEVAAGLSKAEISAKLVLSEATVKTHVGRIFAKLDLRDRVHAVILAYETGLAP